MTELELGTILWERELREMLWEEAQEREEDSRPRAIGVAVGATISPEVGEKSGLIPDKGGAF